MNSPTGFVHRTLACHRRTPSRVIRDIGVAAGRAAGGALALRFALEGDLSAVLIPEQRPSRRVDGLWRHTCFEAFVMAGEGPGYREFNFSPAGEWAIMAFHGYRDGGEPVAEPGPAIAVRRGGERLETGRGDPPGVPADGLLAAPRAVRGGGRRSRRTDVLGVAPFPGSARFSSIGCL